MQSPVTTSLNYVRFAYRPTLDVVVAESNSPLETPDEFERCYAEYAQYFGSKFPDRKVDIIFDLSNFRIGAGMASEFTKMRAELMRNFARLTYRVGVASAARGAMLMGTVRHGLPTNECSSIDGAIAALVADREALAGVGRHLETAYRVRHEAKGRADVSGSRWGHGHSGIAEVQSIASFRDRWTLVDSFEHDGQRYILARSSRATGPDMEVLSEREREVVIQAMAGQHNKAIAYELGLAMSTVRVLMARAALKLGARSRKDLLDKARSIAEMRDKPLD